MTALHMAALEGYTAVAKALLAECNAHASSNAADGDGNTPLYRAAVGGHTETVLLLLAAPDLATEVMASSAIAAATAGHAELAITVLKALMARDMPAAAAVMADQSVAARRPRCWGSGKLLKAP
jgi:ankyrin repeat protein